MAPNLRWGPLAGIALATGLLTMIATSSPFPLANIPAHGGGFLLAALLTKLGSMDDETRDDVGHFLGTVWGNEGGFAANTRIPFADGLSTFTALLTAADVGRRDLIRKPIIERFVTGELEFPTGGFRGAAWDDQADVEYTFYGLGVLGLIGTGTEAA